MIISKTGMIFILTTLILTSCSNGQKEKSNEVGKVLNLEYQILSKEKLFPNDNIDFYSAYLVINIPKGVTYLDVAETIRNIGIKENLMSVKIFNSMTGYLMEKDSIKKTYDGYYRSYEGYYELTTKGLIWKHLFKINDIHFKGEMPLKIDMN